MKKDKLFRTAICMMTGMALLAGCAGNEIATKSATEASTEVTSVEASSEASSEVVAEASTEASSTDDSSESASSGFKSGKGEKSEASIIADVQTSIVYAVDAENEVYETGKYDFIDSSDDGSDESAESSSKSEAADTASSETSSDSSAEESSDMTVEADTVGYVRLVWENVFNKIIDYLYDYTDMDQVTFESEQKKWQDAVNKEVAAIQESKTASEDKVNYYVAEATKTRVYQLYRMLFREFEAEETIKSGSVTCTIHWPCVDVNEQFKECLEEKDTLDYIKYNEIKNVYFVDVDNDDELEMCFSAVKSDPFAVFDVYRGEIAKVLEYSYGNEWAITYHNDTVFLVNYRIGNGDSEEYYVNQLEGYDNKVMETWFKVSYDNGSKYTEDSLFICDNKTITMEEFETLRDYYFSDRYITME